MQRTGCSFRWTIYSPQLRKGFPDAGSVVPFYRAGNCYIDSITPPLLPARKICGTLRARDVLQPRSPQILRGLITVAFLPGSFLQFLAIAAGAIPGSSINHLGTGDIKGFEFLSVVNGRKRHKETKRAVVTRGICSLLPSSSEEVR